VSESETCSSGEPVEAIVNHPDGRNVLNFDGSVEWIRLEDEMVDREVIARLRELNLAR